jgi:putative LysE/RhtB family amino acid efflux pump
MVLCWLAGNRYHGRVLSSIAKGVWLGFCIAAPVGPIGTLVLKQSLQWGFRAGLASGLGATLADLSYGFLAAAGVRLAAAYARPVAVLGGGFLLWLAWRSWRETPPQNVAVPEPRSLIRNVVTTFLLTLSNPMTILAFAAMIASTGADAPEWFVLGIFSGSMLWWIILSLTSAWLAAFLKLRGALLNRIAAVTLGAFGVWAIFAKGLK